MTSSPPHRGADGALLSQQTRGVRYPRTLHYFTLLAYFNDVRRAYEQTFRQSVATAKQAHGINAPQVRGPLRTRLQEEFVRADDFARASIYAITRPVAEVMIETANRLWGAQQYDFVLDAPPITPLWVEFLGNAVLGDESMYVRGLLFRPIAGVGIPKGFTEAQVVKADLHDPEKILAAGLEPARGFEVTLFDDEAGTKSFTYGAGPAGVWSLNQIGPCASGAVCSIARRTRANARYSVHKTLDMDEAFQQHSGKLCRCYTDGMGWAAILYALLNLLNAEGVTHTQETHAASVDDHLPNKVRRKANEAAEAWNGKFHKHFVTLSIAQRVHRVRVKRTPGAAGDARLLDDDATDDDDDTPSAMRSVGVPTHFRLLIPGPGKPWRGDRPRIISVSSYRYERRAGQRTRSATIRLMTP